MGHDIEYRDSDKRTALFGAAQFGQVEATSVLLSRIYEEDLPLLDGADATDSFGVTPFIQAAQGGHVESVKQLEDMEVEVHNEDETDRDALFHAAYNDHAAVVRHLVLETKLAVDCRDLAGLTPLVVAAQQHRNLCCSRKPCRPPTSTLRTTSMAPRSYTPLQRDT